MFVCIFQTSFDNDIWIRLDEYGNQYKYIYTYVDDYMICSNNADRVMKDIKLVYLVKD